MSGPGSRQSPNAFRSTSWCVSVSLGPKTVTLSIGRQSDYPANVLATPRHVDSVVVATLVKERLVTWSAIDWLADLLTKTLGRKIFPEQIRHSGLKDRWAVTTQSIVIFGVTVEELRRVNWSHSPGRAGFFLKDIHWHDGRRRLHTGADEKRNRVFTEAIATVRGANTRMPFTQLRDSIIARVRPQVVKALGRDIRPECFTLKGSGNDYRLQISHVSAAEVDAIKWDPREEVSLQHVRLLRSNTLSKGDHQNNRFELKIVVKGHDSDAVSDYLMPLMERLERRSFCIPNAINFQRLAARQLGHMHGYTLITGDFAAPDGVHAFGTASEAALYRFLTEVSGRENAGAEQMRKDMEPHWLYDFSGMQQKLLRSYRQLNMSVEYKVVERLADVDKYRGDFQEVVRSMSEEVSMWVAAWHSWWWNQVLVRKLPHWIREMDQSAAARVKSQALECVCTEQAKAEHQKLRCECSCDDQRCQTCKRRSRLPSCARCKLDARAQSFNALQKGIPILLDTPQARQYYERLSYCRDALEQLGKADDFVRHQFLRPRGNTPWRKAFIRIDDLNYDVAREQIDNVEQTVVNLQFNLPSGAYATTFLGFLFELEEPNRGAVRNPASPDSDTPDLVDETE